MTINLVTHFDINYLDRGIALYRSCLRHLPDFHLWIFALDNHVLNRVIGLENVTEISWVTIDSNELQKARKNRTHQEWCWTLTPIITAYVLEQVDSVIYVDADSFLFDNPRTYFDEIKNANADIAIIPHHFPPGKDKSQNGIYNVNWVYFRNTPNALACLNEWRKQCLAWCYARSENGKYADQKYLDTWVDKYGAHIVKNIGVNLAPWSVEQYFYEYDNRLYIIDMDARIDYGKPHIRRIDSLSVYHFHDWLFSKRSNYNLPDAVARYAYEPYENEIRAIRKELEHAKVKV